MVSELHGMVEPVVLAAFGGWNDAGDAATDTLAHLEARYPSKKLFELDSEEYFDYQATRPNITRDEFGAAITWPAITVSQMRLPEQDLMVIQGPEPNLRWPTFSRRVCDMVADAEPKAAVLMGAMLSDTPHSRQLPISGSSTDSTLADRLALEVSTYEGPTGIVGVLAQMMAREGIPVTTLWASVPHYVSSPPIPKATLALLRRLETLLGVPLDMGDLPALAQSWESDIDQIAEKDPEIAEYIQSLVERSDETPLPPASGEAIAAELERFLRDRR